MNEAQIFLFFLAVLSFGWIGFVTGKNEGKHKNDRFLEMVFFIGSGAMAIVMLICLAFALGKSF